MVATQHALTFFNPKELTVHLYTDDREWKVHFIMIYFKEWQKMGDPVLHIEVKSIKFTFS